MFFICTAFSEAKRDKKAKDDAAALKSERVGRSGSIGSLPDDVSPTSTAFSSPLPSTTYAAFSKVSNDEGFFFLNYNIYSCFF